MAIQTVNPATGETVEKFEPTTPAELERIAAGAQAAFQEWRGGPSPSAPGACARPRASSAPARRSSRAR